MTPPGGLHGFAACRNGVGQGAPEPAKATDFVCLEDAHHDLGEPRWNSFHIPVLQQQAQMQMRAAGFFINVETAFSVCAVLLRRTYAPINIVKR